MDLRTVQGGGEVTRDLDHRTSTVTGAAAFEAWRGEQYRTPAELADDDPPDRGEW